MKAKKDKGWDRGFRDGYICAVATLVKQHGESTMAADVLACLGAVDIREVDVADRPAIRTVLREPRLQRTL